MPIKKVIDSRLPVKIWTSDVDEVMMNQSDLVEVVHTLKQVVNIKG